VDGAREIASSHVILHSYPTYQHSKSPRCYDYERSYHYAHDDEHQRSEHWNAKTSTCKPMANRFQSGRGIIKRRTPSLLLTIPEGSMD